MSREANLWWQPHKFEQKKPYLEARNRALKAIRDWFDGQGFIEVETPILQTCPVMDTHIHGFKTEVLKPDLTPARNMYLHTSPEFAMKKLLVAGMPKIYQMCHVFRNAEGSRLHSPEFTMLEWYRTEASYREIMEDCIGLLRHVARELGIQKYRYRELEADPFAEWEIISVAEAFLKYADIKLEEYLPMPPHPNPPPNGRREEAHGASGGEEVERFNQIISSLNIRTAPDDSWDDLFFRVMAEKIEPHLGGGAPAILYDYPVVMASLARKKPEDPRFAERFEMYVCGVELCNAFSELTDAAEQRKRFEEAMAEKRKIYGYDYPVEEDFLKALEYGLPACSGNALGFDRLVMLATGAEDIEQVLWAGKP